MMTTHKVTVDGEEFVLSYDDDADSIQCVRETLWQMLASDDAKTNTASELLARQFANAQAEQHEKQGKGE